jgi:protocatechuate 3,4-dioxygenase beta subunit
MKKRSLLFLFWTFLLCNSSQTVTSLDVTGNRDTLSYSSKIVLVKEGEPGEKMVISGTVYLPDRKTPAKGAVLAVWQTDENGLYFLKGKEGPADNPRIRGRMKTGADGKYEFHSIKPASYPGSRIPSHIHVHISAPDFPEYGLEYLFEGDTFITAEDRRRAEKTPDGPTFIIKLTKNSKGILTGRCDLILKYVKPSGETMKLAW